MTTLEELIEANKHFLAGEPRSLDPAGPRFAVLGCIDDRLTGMCESALGLPRRRALVVRTAGNQLSDSCHDALRSIVAAVHIGGAVEVFIVGHTGCRMAAFSTSDAIEAFRSRGIPRSAFGSEDLRRWFGAIQDVRRNVLESLSYLRNSGLLHPAVKLHGLIIDSEMGSIEIVHDGDKATDPRPADVPEATAEARSAEAKESVPEQIPPAQPPPVPKRKPIHIPASPPKAPPVPKSRSAAGNDDISVVDAVGILRDVLAQERENSLLQKSVQDLKLVVRKEKNPFVVVYQFEKLLSNYREKYPKLPSALSVLKKSLSSKGSVAETPIEYLRKILQ